jgi:TolB protein
MKRSLLIPSAALVLVTAAGAAAPPVARGPGLVVAQSGRIYVDGRVVARGAQPTWSPDGTRIAFARFGLLFVVDADGRHERRLLERTPSLHWPASFPAWSPDGRRLAFSGTRDLFTVSVANGTIRQLTRSGESWRLNATPAYSPDGRTIAFTRSTDAFNTDLFLARADGSRLRRLTTSVGTEEHQAEESMPTWSPDGRTIVFTSNRDGNGELYAIGRDGRGEVRLTRTPRSDEENPRFSADGRRLLYTHDGRVATMRADGTGVRELGLGVAADWN